MTERVGHAIRHKSRSVIELNKKEPITVRMVKNNSEEYKKLKNIQKNLNGNQQRDKNYSNIHKSSKLK